MDFNALEDERVVHGNAFAGSGTVTLQQAVGTGLSFASHFNFLLCGALSLGLLGIVSSPGLPSNPYPGLGPGQPLNAPVTIPRSLLESATPDPIEAPALNARAPRGSGIPLPDFSLSSASSLTAVPIAVPPISALTADAATTVDATETPNANRPAPADNPQQTNAAPLPPQSVSVK